MDNAAIIAFAGLERFNSGCTWSGYRYDQVPINRIRRAVKMISACKYDLITMDALIDLSGAPTLVRFIRGMQR